MNLVPVRLGPGGDLRGEIEAALRAHGGEAAFVLAGIGSLSRACLRFAGRDDATALVEPLEIVSLSGTVSPAGAHLHASVSTATGQVLGGHVAPGCIVRTTAELLVAFLPEWRFDRRSDPATGYLELVVEQARRAGAG